MPLTSISHKSVATTCTAVSVLLILVATLSPDFKLAECTSTEDTFFLLKWIPSPNTSFIKLLSPVSDFTLNVLLFLPLGTSLTWLFKLRYKKTSLQIIAVVFCICLGLTYIVEVTQVFLPSRCAQLNDVLSNSLGGVLGSFLYFSRKTFLLELLLARIRAFKYFLSNYRKTVLLGWVLVGFIISIPLQQKTSLRNWKDDYYLLIGNEMSGDRPWQGEVSELFLTKKAMPSGDVKKIFNGKSLHVISGNTLLAFYSFQKSNQYFDRTNKSLPFQRQGISSESILDGVVTSDKQWLRTGAPPSRLTKSIREAGQFTIGLTASSHNALQIGPARIVSLSSSPVLRNFTIGQNNDDLIFRLRSPMTGNNGTNPSFIAPGVFKTSEVKKITITYDGAILRIYTGDPHKYHEFKLTPGAALFSYLMPIKSSLLYLYDFMFYVFIFSPLGILYIGMKRDGSKEKMNYKLAGIFASITLTAILLEGILVYASSKKFMIGNIFVCIIASALPYIINLGARLVERIFSEHFQE